MSQSDVCEKNTAGESGVIVLDTRPSFRPNEDSSPTAKMKHSKDSTKATDSVYKRDSKKLSTEVHSPSSRRKLDVARKTSSTTKKLASEAKNVSPETNQTASPIKKPPEKSTVAPVDAEVKKGSVPAEKDNVMPVHPIPDIANVSDPKKQKKISQEEKVAEEENANDVVTELQTRPKAKHSEWSDDEEASGLPREGSHSRRITRAVRHLFCCGAPNQAPDEDNTTYDRTDTV